LSYKPALLAAVLAVSLGAAPRPSDGRSPDELRLLRTLSIDSLGPVPADPSNRVADDAGAAELGRLLFNDRRLSANGTVSCASCHDPAHGFTDRTRTGRGMGTGSRRTMPIAPAIYSSWQFWDGRADSLWAQALGPIENPVEHGFTRAGVARVIRSAYGRRYTSVFGPLPNLRGAAASPLGDPAARRRWAALPRAERDGIDVVFANAGKAIAAFERRQKVPEARLDLYVRWLASPSGTSSPMSAQEVAGLRIFAGKGRCTTCHSGPLLTSNEFANTGVPERNATLPDRGRIEGVRKALADPFNCRGRFNDDPRKNCSELDFAVAGSPEQVRAYKVPSLRGVASRPPYMHAGQFRTLDAVVQHYSAAPKAPAGQSQLKPLQLNAAERRSLVAFLKTLDPVVTSGGRKP